MIEHLEELRELYKYIPKTIQQLVSGTPRSIYLNQSIIRNLLGEAEYKSVPNPDYPQESYESFIKRLIEIKKEIIVEIVKKS